MNKFKTVIFLFVLIYCCGCTPTIKVQDGLNANFVDKKFDDFVVQYGPPVSKYVMDDGNIVYLWDSGVENMTFPSQYTVNTSGNNGLVIDQTGGGTIYMKCGLRIISSNNNIIKNIVITKDTIGIWNSSRCAEVFSVLMKK